jgi:hypothetical protein
MSEEVMTASYYIMSDVSVGMHVISVHQMPSKLGTILKHISLTETGIEVTSPQFQ